MIKGCLENRHAQIPITGAKRQPGIVGLMARYIVGGPLLAVVVASIISSGAFLALVIVWGKTFVETFLVPMILPSILAFPGAALARSRELSWRTAAGCASAALITATSCLLVKDFLKNGEGFGQIPRISIAAATIALLTGGTSDMIATMFPPITSLSTTKRTALAVLTAICIVYVVVGTAHALQHPVRLTWM